MHAARCRYDAVQFPQIYLKARLKQSAAGLLRTQEMTLAGRQR
jgi:hypothetical protein